MSESQMKTLLITSFDIPEGQTIDKNYYVETLKQLDEDERTRRLELWPNDLIIYHDNVPAPKALSFKKFLLKYRLLKMKRPPYSHNLAPDDFLMFPNITSAFKG
jgi:hypothetical protein